MRDTGGGMALRKGRLFSIGLNFDSGPMRGSFLQTLPLAQLG
jgi:hypothetical protein